MKSTRPPSSASTSSASSTTPASNGTRTTSRATSAPAPGVTSPGLKTKTLATPAKTRPTTAIPAKTPGKAGEKHEAPKPVTIAEIYKYIKRQLFQDESLDPERDTVIRNKITESFKESLNLEEDIAKTRERLAGPCEAARAESKQIQEDNNKQVTILRRKFLEEEGRNQKLQVELAELKKITQDLSNRLMFTENNLTIEKNQGAVLIENITIIEREAAVASKALENAMRTIAGLRKPAIIPEASSTPQHSQEAVSQQVIDAENAIKNLSDILKTTDINPAQEPYQELGGSTEPEELEEEAVVEDEEASEPNGVAGESDGELSSDDDEVIHVEPNGKHDHPADEPAED